MSSESPLEAPVWRSKALCRGMPLEVFFEPENEPLAVSICQRCEVRHECLAEIVIRDRKLKELSDGIFGGLNRYQRSRLRGRIK